MVKYLPGLNDVADPISAIDDYEGEGVGARGVAKSDHCIIYVGRHPPPLQRDEMPRRMPGGQVEAALQPTAIRVVPFDRTTTLDPMSRLNLAEVKVMELGGRGLAAGFGRVHEESLTSLVKQFQVVQCAHQTQTSGRASAMPANGAAARGGPFTSGSPAQSRLSEQQVRERIDALERYARQHGFTMPRLTGEQIRSMVENPERFQAVVKALRERWAQQKEEEEYDESDEESD